MLRLHSNFSSSKKELLLYLCVQAEPVLFFMSHYWTRRSKSLRRSRYFDLTEGMIVSFFHMPICVHLTEGRVKFIVTYPFEPKIVSWRLSDYCSIKKRESSKVIGFSSFGLLLLPLRCMSTLYPE